MKITKEEARKLADAMEDGHALTGEDQLLWQRLRQHAGQPSDFDTDDDHEVGLSDRGASTDKTPQEERDEFLRAVVEELKPANERWPGLWTRLEWLLNDHDEAVRQIESWRVEDQSRDELRARVRELTEALAVGPIVLNEVLRLIAAKEFDAAHATVDEFGKTLTRVLNSEEPK